MDTSRTVPVLVGEDIETPGNADCLRAAAALFDWHCELIERSETSCDALAQSGMPIIALENTSGAEDLFRFRPPDGAFALVVGNERNGVSRRLLRVADRVVQIPVGPGQLNCLNVAAAAAVAIHRIARPGRTYAGSGRPSILFAGAADPIELGSAVRSAACFGWTEVSISDPHAVWFATDRVTRSLGRGAARRARNGIRVRHGADLAAFADICVVAEHGEPLSRADLRCDLVVIGEHDVPPGARRIRLEVARPPPFRLAASIVLAELARRLRYGGVR